jgi:aspartokinase
MAPEISRLADRIVNEGAIIMALKRQSPNYYYQVRAGIKDFLRRLGPITIRNHINDYTYRNSPSLLRLQRDIFAVVAGNPNTFYSFSQGIHESTILASSSIDRTISKLLQNETLISSRKALASITILLPKDNTEISGIYYLLFKQLAWQDINVVEVISTTHEFTLVVDEKDLEASFRLLRTLMMPAQTK